MVIADQRSATWYSSICLAIGDWLMMAINPDYEITTLGPIPHPISTFSLPFTSIRLLTPVSVLVMTSDFSLGAQEMTMGVSLLFSR
jgi:hypothetical protein